MTGSYNVAVGHEAGLSVSGAGNVICIGAGVAGADVSNTTWIGNVYGNATLNGQAAPVVVSVDGQLATNVSSERFKKDIVTMEKTSEVILSLRPVTFHYKSDAKGTPEFGLIAEEVAEVNSDLVVRDETGAIYTVRYDAVNAMLLNEFLKEHKAFLWEQRKVQEQDATIAQVKSNAAKQEATIAELKSGMQALTATVKEQASQIQKVSAQLATASPSRGGLEASKPASQVVLNRQ